MIDTNMPWKETALAIRRIFACAFLLTILLGSSHAYSQSPALRIEPSDTTLHLGQSCEIRLIIDNAVNLGAFEFELAALQSIIRIDSIELGDFLGSTGRIILPVGPRIGISGDSVIVRFGGLSFGTAPGPSGKGVLAKFTIFTQAIGSTALDLRNVVITNTLGQSQTPRGINDGRLTVLGDAVDPALSEVMAVPDLVAADTVCWLLVKVIPRDAGGNTLPVGQIVSLSTTAGTLIGTIKSNNDGSYTQRLYAPSQPGNGIVTATVNGIVIQQRPQVVFTPKPQRAVSVLPGEQNVLWGSEFEVAIHADSVCDLGSFEFSLAYPNGILEFVAAEPGDFPGSSGRNVIPTTPRFAPAGDTTMVTFGSFSIGAARGPDGSGALARLRFRATGLDTAQLAITRALLTTSEGKGLSVGQIIGGRVNIIVDAMDPKLSLIFAEPDSIPADGISISVITVVPRNASGDTLPPGLPIELSTTTGRWQDPGASHKDGTYTRTLIADATPGEANLSATVNSEPLEHTARVVFFEVPTRVLAIAPSDTTVFLGRRFGVRIGVENASQMAGFELRLRLPNRIVQADSVWLGDFLGSNGRSVQLVGPVFQNLGDTTEVSFGAFSIGVESPPSGKGVLAHFQLAPVSLDTATLELSDAMIVNPVGERQLPLELRHGRVVVAPSPVDAANSIVRAEPESLPANGRTFTTITVIPRNAAGDTLPPCQKVEIDLIPGLGSWVDEVNCHDDGSYTRILQAPLSAGQTQIEARVNGVAVTQRPTVVFTPANSTSMRLEPAPHAVLVRNGFELELVIENVTDLGGFELTVGFLSRILRYDEVKPGSLLASGRRQFFLIDSVSNPTSDSTVVRIAGFSVGNQSGVSGSGVLVRLAFTASAIGVTGLDISGVVLVNPKSEILPFAAATPGLVRVIAGVIDPILSTVAAEPDSGPADNVFCSNITIVPRDTSGLLLGPGANVVLTEIGTGELRGPVIDHGDGTYSQKLCATLQPGVSVATVVVEGVTLAQQANVRFKQVPTIFARVGSSEQNAGDTFWVNVGVLGASSIEEKIAKVHFALRFDEFDRLYCVQDGVRPGDFLGPPHEIDFFYDPLCESGKVVFDISRRYSGAALADSGTLAEVQFKSDRFVTDSTCVNFSITELNVEDSLGNPIHLLDGSFDICIRGPLVWPGDTNNDGIVNQADWLPIGIYYGQTGPARLSASTTWFGQHATRWQTDPATFADGNGDGEVNSFDQTVVLANWGMQPGMLNAASEFRYLSALEGGEGVLVLAVEKAIRSAEWIVNVIADSVATLQGLAFELTYPAGELEFASVAGNDSWGSDAQLFHRDDETAGQIGFAICSRHSLKTSAESAFAARFRFKPRNHVAAEQIMPRFEVREVVAVNANGNWIELQGVALGAENQAGVLPSDFLLEQNYPNPFNPGTSISFVLPHSSRVTLTVYDVLGSVVRKLVDELRPAGRHILVWDGKDMHGKEAPSGVYFVKLKAESMVKTLRAVKTK